MRAWIITALGLLLAVPPSAAQRNTPVGVERPAVLKKWLGVLEETERALEAGEWKKARRTTERLLAEMCDRIEGGDGVENLLATAALLRAVAEAGLGNEAEANWDFHTAQTMVPELSKVDLSRFGEVGAMFDAWRNTEETSTTEPEETPEKVRMEEKAPPPDDITPPRKRYAPRPKYPYAKYQACLDGPIIVRSIINKEGRPVHPELLSKQEPVLGFAALEALREWRFKPSMRDGEPVTVYYNLTVNFGLPRCTNLFALRQQAQKEAEEASGSSEAP